MDNWLDLVSPNLRMLVRGSGEWKPPFNYHRCMRVGITRNSCDKCSEHMISDEDPWRSTCHDFRCRVVIPNHSENELAEGGETNFEAQPPFLLSTPQATIDALPLEILANVFDYLDGYSLYCSGNVCSRWSDLIQSRTKKYQKRFEMAFDSLWPSPYRQMYSLMDDEVFSSLLNSVNCKTCFLREGDWTMGQTEISPYRPPGRRLHNETRELPIDGVHAIPFEDMMNKLIARIEGPKDSPFENGIFYLTVNTKTKEYGFKPPRVRFLTKIFHPAVSCHGHISVDFLGCDWSPSLTISKVLLSIQSLLTDKDFEICEHTPIGKLFKKDRAEYERIARIWTRKFAMQHLIHPVTSSPNAD